MKTNFDYRSNELLGMGKELVHRGMSLYGRKAIANLSYKVGLALLDDDTVEWLDPWKYSPEVVIRRFLIEYSKINLPAKMTAIVYSRRYQIPLPLDIRKTSRIAKLKRWVTR